MVHPKEMATVWVIRGGERNRLVATFLRDGVIGADYPTLPDGRTVDRAKALSLLAAPRPVVVPDGDDEPEEPKPPEAEAAMFLSFVRRMEVGDLVVMPDPQAGGLAVGVVAGDYEYHDELEPDRCRHRRPVEWRRRLPDDQLPERLAHVPRQRKLLDDVADGRLRDLALRCCAGEVGEDPLDRPSRPVRTSSGVPRARKPPRPPKATIAERRCANCFLVKPEELFEGGGDWCRDCL